MKSSKFLDFTKKNNDKILLTVFFIEWIVSVVKWISNYPPLQLLSFDLWINTVLFHSILIIFLVLDLYWVSINIPIQIFNLDKKKEKSLKNIKKLKDKLSEDSRNFNLLSSVLILFLSFLIEFWEFSYYSFYSTIYIAAIFFIITLFIYYLITNPSLRNKIIFIFTIFLLIVVYIIIWFIPLCIELTIWYYTPLFKLSIILFIILCSTIMIIIKSRNISKQKKE